MRRRGLVEDAAREVGGAAVEESSEFCDGRAVEVTIWERNL